MIINDTKDAMLGLLNELSGGDPVARGLITVWFLALCSYMARSVPAKISSFIRTSFTVTMFINRDDDVKSMEFYAAVENFLIRENWFAVRNRSTTITDLDKNTGLGEGIHLMFIRGRFIQVYKARVKNNKGFTEESLKLTTPGRNASVYDYIVKECMVKDDKRYFWEVTNSFNDDPWRKTAVLGDSPQLFLQETVRKELHRCLDDFLANREWYRKNGKPYRLNIILYGPPGTGKTELTRYISNYLASDLYNLSPYDLGGGSLRSVTRKMKTDRMAVVAVEDFESIALSRALKKKSLQLANMLDNNQNEEIEKLKQEDKDFVDLESVRYSHNDISDLLNALQGLRVIENIVVVMTTNHIDLIDEAVTRGSRCDLKLYVGPLGLEQVKGKFEQQYDQPFPNYIRDIKPIKACDLDALSSKNAFDADGFLTGLIENYGVTEDEQQPEHV